MSALMLFETEVATSDPLWQFGLAGAVFAAVFGGITLPVIRSLIAQSQAAVDKLGKSVDTQTLATQSLQIAVQSLQKVDERVAALLPQMSALMVQLDRRADELSDQIDELRRGGAA